MCVCVFNAKYAGHAQAHIQQEAQAIPGSEFRRFLMDFGYLWVQCKSGEKSERLNGGGGAMSGSTWPTRMVHLSKFAEFSQEMIDNI